MVEPSNTIEEINKLANRIRKTVVTMAEYSQDTMHWGGSLSCIDILATLYGRFLNFSSSLVKNNNRDKFILSKGHSALALYATMYNVGMLTSEELGSYQQNGSSLTELIEYNPKKNFDCSGGSLGLGLSYAAGCALLAKKENLDYQVYILMGDGEMNEGSVWEALMFSSQMKLDNLTLIIDLNKMQSDGNTDDIISWNNLYAQLDSFGWNVIEVDGHEVEQLVHAFSCKGHVNKPKAIIAHTIKGKGISFMENDNSWHDRKITKQELSIAKEEADVLC